MWRFEVEEASAAIRGQREVSRPESNGDSRETSVHVSPPPVSEIGFAKAIVP
jgi:hypothetical protein